MDFGEILKYAEENKTKLEIYQEWMRININSNINIYFALYTVNLQHIY